MIINANFVYKYNEFAIGASSNIPYNKTIQSLHRKIVSVRIIVKGMVDFG